MPGIVVPCRDQRAASPQHPLHLLRRPCLPGHQRLWRSAAACRDAEHRPAGQRRDAVRPLPGAQFDLRAQPRHRAYRQVQPLQWLLQQHEQPFRRLADDVPQAAAGRGLSDRDLRQVAPGDRPDRLRRLANPARPGRVLQPADDRGGRQGQASGLRDRHHHRPLAGLAQETRPVEAVSADVPAQGAAPRMGTGPASPRPRQ